MEKTLLTKVVTQLVNERANAQEYGVALVNIPDFDYVAFALGLSSERKAALFFLGFPESARALIESELSQIGSRIAGPNDIRSYLSRSRIASSGA